MTTLVAYKDSQGRLWYGSDSQCTLRTGRVLKMKKWDIEPKFALAGCGRVFEIEIMKRAIYEALAGEYDSVNVVKSINEKMSGVGSKLFDDEGEMRADNSFILLKDGEIWYLSHDMSFANCGNIWAEGSGARFAMGAIDGMLAADPAMADDPENLVRRAIEIAIKHDNGSGGEIVVGQFIQSS